MSEFKIQEIYAREILDSRGNPTVEAEAWVAKGRSGECVSGRAAAPSGASTGAYEAVELRDGEKRYLGKGVGLAVEHIRTGICESLSGKDVTDQELIDELMMGLDGTDNKGRLGANAILAVSLAVAKAGAKAYGMPLYRYIGGISGSTLPVPMMNILNGGAHTNTNVDFQEFMIMPVGAGCFREGVRICAEIYHVLKRLLSEDGYSTAVGDEGGFAPELRDAYEVFDYLMRAVTEAGYQPGKDIVFSMDAAASELYNPDSGMYYFRGESRIREQEAAKRQGVDGEENGRIAAPDTERVEVIRTSEQLIELYEDLVNRYPIYSIEDGLGEEDWDGWRELTKRLGNRVLLVGDDLFVTNPKRLCRGIREGCGNAVLIKPNQIGTLSETMETIRQAKQNGYRCIMSHRSGETEDTTIADLAVAMNTGYIKTGAPCRGERTAKYNRLLNIEEELGRAGRYGQIERFSDQG